MPTRQARESDELNEKQLNVRISDAAGDTEALLRISLTHEDTLRPINVASLWNKLGKQRDTLQPQHAAALQRLLRQTHALLASCRAQELAIVAHGVAASGASDETRAQPTVAHSSFHLFAAVAEAAVGKACEFKPQELSNTAWAFATVGLRADTLFVALAAAAAEKSSKFKPQELANMAWAFATVGVRADALFVAVAAAAAGKASEFKPQELANMAWAFATANVVQPSVLAEVARCVECSYASSAAQWTDANLSQLHQWQVWVALERRQPDSPELLPPALRARCRQAMVAGSDKTVSRIQRQVGWALEAVFPGVELEVLDEETGYSLDLTLREEHVAVEVDGPSHFLLPDASGSRVPKGTTLLKRRLLRAAGWCVVPVPVYEWTELGRGEGSRERHHEYLARALEQYVNRSPLKFDAERWQIEPSSPQLPDADRRNSIPAGFRVGETVEYIGPDARQGHVMLTRGMQGQVVLPSSKSIMDRQIDRVRVNFGKKSIGKCLIEPRDLVRKP